MTANNARRSSELADAVRRNPRRRCTLHNLWQSSGESSLDKGADEDAPAAKSDELEARAQARKLGPAQTDLDAENFDAAAGNRKLKRKADAKPDAAHRSADSSPQPQDQSPKPQDDQGSPRPFAPTDSENAQLRANQQPPRAHGHIRKRAPKRSLPAPPPLPAAPAAQAPDRLGIPGPNPAARGKAEPTKRRRTRGDDSKREVEALEASVQAQVAARAALDVHVQWLEKRNRQLSATAARATQSHEAHLMASEDAAALRLRCRELVLSLDRAELTRRALHEAHMTLRGNMRVFCRLRPGSGADAFRTDTGTAGDLRVRAPATKTVDGRAEASKTLPFKFDYVFPDSARQSDVFAEVEGLVQSALDGHNVCIFAYGQTGSGKTHTMSNHLGADPGIIPRALDLILAAHPQRPRMSLLEIYNEELRDLLRDADADPATDGAAAKPARRNKRATASAGTKLRIGIDPRRGTPQLQGLTEVTVSNMAHARTLLDHAERTRMVARTNANERSSRSHIVLTLTINHPETESTSRLHLVDLAGSERIAHAGSDRTAKMLKEQCSINTSLVALKNTLRALATKQTHVPFRDSKLTHLLQDALESKSCKTLMLCTLSQDTENVAESLNTLRFASQVLQN